MSQAVLSRLPKLRVLPLIMLIAGPLLMAGCADNKDVYVERPVEQLYNSAMDDLMNENYVKSAKEFDEVERQHPYSVWASKAQLMAAYAHYQHNKFDDAITALDRFIQLHPSHKDVAYAYYLKAICYYEQIADVERDQKSAYVEFTTPYAGLPQVIRPDGVYASQQRFGMYRWHIMDPVRFEQDLRITIQALGWRTDKDRRYLPLQDDIASVAYWYQTLPTAPFPALPDKDYLEVV